MRLILEHKMALGVLFVLTFALYANTLNHNFVLDDKIVITENEFTKKGLAGISEIFSNDSMTGFFGKKKNLVAGGRYRPLSMTSHALEWELLGEKPFIYHFNNILLYGLSVLLLYLILLYVFPKTNQAFYLSAPFVIAAIFAANPLHTEVVANIKSRDEIMSILFTFSSILFLFKGIETKKGVQLLIASLLFFAGLLSKESSIVFLGIIPVVWYFNYRNKSIKDFVMPLVSIALPSVLYILMRISVIGMSQPPIANELMNNPFLNASSSEQFATAFFVLLLYIKLSFIPHPLTHDYYPKQIAITNWEDPMVLLSVLIHLIMIAAFLWGLKKRHGIAVLTGVYLGGIALYSNLLFPIGTFMNERFLYVPSIALAAIMGVILTKYVKATPVKMVILVLILGLYSFKTIDRNKVWESDETLAITDVEVSSESAKCNFSAGASLVDLSEKELNRTKKNKMLDQAIVYLNKSLKIYPKYSYPILILGNAYSGKEEYKQAIYYYDLCLKYNSQAQFAYNNLVIIGDIAIEKNKFDDAEKAFLTYLNYKNDGKVLLRLGKHYGKNMNRLDKSIEYLEKAKLQLPNNSSLIQNLGVAYAMSGNHQKAADLFLKGTVLSPENANIWLNLGYATMSLGNTEKAEQYLLKAYKLDPKLNPNR